MSSRFTLDQINPKYHAQVAAQLYPKAKPPAAEKPDQSFAEPSESKSQQSLIRWWSAVYRSYGFDDERVLMAFPLQGARTKANGARMKAEGLRAGTWDLQLIVSRGDWHSLWIEMKTSKGRLSPEQITMQKTLVAQGHLVQVCRSCDEARVEIERYLNLVA